MSRREIVRTTANGWTVRSSYPDVPEDPTADMKATLYLATAWWLACLPFLQSRLRESYDLSLQACAEMVDSEKKEVLRKYFFRTAPAC